MPHVSGRRAHSGELSLLTDTTSGQKGQRSVNRFQPSEGVFCYLLGLVIIAAHPGRFWLGFGLAIVPLVVGPLGRAIGGDLWRNA